MSFFFFLKDRWRAFGFHLIKKKRKFWWQKICKYFTEFSRESIWTILLFLAFRSFIVSLNFICREQLSQLSELSIWKLILKRSLQSNGLVEACISLEHFKMGRPIPAGACTYFVFHWNNFILKHPQCVQCLVKRNWYSCLWYLVEITTISSDFYEHVVIRG